MKTHIDWISVEDHYPTLSDGVTSVLFVWNGDVFTGWPVDEREHLWEAASDGASLAYVTHWAYYNRPGGSDE